jgi:RNA polymerase sigma factor (sigma-70 family)
MSETLRDWWKIARQHPGVPDVYAKLLWKRMARGDEQARDEFVLSHVWIAIWQAERMTRRLPPRLRDDAASAAIYAGVVALYKALIFFNEKRKIKFSSFAILIVRQSVRAEMKKEFETIRVPRTPGSVQPRFTSLNRTRTNDGDDDDRAFQLEAADPSPHRMAEAAETKTRIEQALAKLEPRERFIIRQRHGLDGEAQTLEAVGDALGVTRERIRQIEALAMAKLAVMLSERPK